MAQLQAWENDRTVLEAESQRRVEEAEEETLRAINQLNTSVHEMALRSDDDEEASPHLEALLDEVRQTRQEADRRVKEANNLASSVTEREALLAIDRFEIIAYFLLR